MSTVSIQKADYFEIPIESLLDPLGGINNFIDPGDKVLLKVNLLSPRDPEKAVTTHPALVKAVAIAVKQAGAHPFIGDSPAGLFSKRALKKAYRNSGLEDLANKENISLNYNTGSRKLDIPAYKKLRKAPFCNFILDADKIIALPKMKTHSFQYITLACKIMYGAIPGLTKARYHALFPSKESFADMLLDILGTVQPHLFIMDGITGMQGQGPANGDPVQLGWIMASTDPVAMDIAVCRSIGIEPVGIPVLRKAKIRDLWPEDIEYPILSPEDITVKDFKLPETADHLRTGGKAIKKSPIITDKCTGCGSCEQICPREAVGVIDGTAKIDYSRCIRCFCCHEVCPEGAIKLGTIK